MLDELRALERRPRAVVALDDVPPLEVVDAPVERAEAIDAVWRAVEQLNPDLKMALLLRDVVGLSYTEIAESLEITLATVKWRIYKAREEVQFALAPRRRRRPDPLCALGRRDPHSSSLARRARRLARTGAAHGRCLLRRAPSGTRADDGSHVQAPSMLLLAFRPGIRGSTTHRLPFP